ncbi:MAG: ABC transporter ATP-binding protein [Vulcanimicrobiaceae bacterium]
MRAITGSAQMRGSLEFGGKVRARWSPEDAARAGIAHFPESRGTLGLFSVLENLELGAYLERSRQAAKSRLERILEYFPQLASRGNQAAGTLSGGEQQMLAIARGLMMAPRLMLLDEPSRGLAPLIVRLLFALLREINARDGVAILVAEQNAAVALEAASRALVLETGRIAASGPSEALAADDQIRELYLGF